MTRPAPALFIPVRDDVLGHRRAAGCAGFCGEHSDNGAPVAPREVTRE